MRRALDRFLGRLFAVLAACLLFVSCGRLDRTTGPVASGGPDRGVTPTTPLGTLPVYALGSAVVVLKPGVNLAAFLARHSIWQTATVTIGTKTYRQVSRNVQPWSIDIVPELVADADVQSCVQLRRLWVPEAEREPMAFDEGDGFRLGGDYTGQPARAQIHVAEAQALSRGAGVKIATFDTGADRYHPAWGDLGSGAMNFLALPTTTGNGNEVTNGVDDDGDSYVDEGFGHGTHVAGIVKMVAPDATVLVYRVLGDDGWGTSMTVAAAILHAVQVGGAQVINMSFGLLDNDELVQDAITYATSAGAVVVASSGNGEANVPSYPGAMTGVVSVAAVGSTDVKASFSNWHSSVDVCAPGVGIVSTIPDPLGLGDYAVSSGTSMAAPFVSGAIALVKAKFPALTMSQCAARVLANTTNISALPGNAAYAGGLGSGRLDLLQPLVAP